MPAGYGPSIQNLSESGAGNTHCEWKRDPGAKSIYWRISDHDITCCISRFYKSQLKFTGLTASAEDKCAPDFKNRARLEKLRKIPYGNMFVVTIIYEDRNANIRIQMQRLRQGF